MIGGLQPLKRVADVRYSSVDKKTVEGQVAVRLCNYTDVYYHERITDDLPFMGASATAEQLNSFELRAGDVLLTKDSETADDIGVSALVASDLPGVLCGYHLALIRPRPELVDGRYLRWALVATAARQQLEVAASGITRFGLRYDAVAGVLVSVLPLREQRAIADYLDAETARIDRAIRARRRLIELVRERMVRAGETLLAGFAPVRLSRIIRSRLAYGVLVPEWDDGPDSVSLVRIMNISETGKVDPDKLGRISAANAREYGRTFISSGDLVVSVVGTIGKVFIVTPELVGANLSRALARIQLRDGIDPYVVLWNFLTSEFSDFVARVTQATAQNVINLEDLAQFQVRTPRAPGDSQRLAVSLREQASLHGALVERLDLQAGLLLERRQALITAAVTGQLEMPGVAA